MVMSMTLVSLVSVFHCDEAWVSKEMATADIVNVVVRNILRWEGMSITGIGLSIEINDIVSHVRIFVNISVVGGVTVGKLIRVWPVKVRLKLYDGHSVGICKEMAIRDKVNVIIGNVGEWKSRSITSIGLSVVIDDIVVHILVLMDISIVSGITVAELF